MGMNEILKVIKTLAKSQGLYARIYHQITDYKFNHKTIYNQLAKELESQNFKDVVDLVMYFEC